MEADDARFVKEKPASLLATDPPPCGNLGNRKVVFLERIYDKCTVASRLLRHHGLYPRAFPMQLRELDPHTVEMQRKRTSGAIAECPEHSKSRAAKGSRTTASCARSLAGWQIEKVGAVDI
jgi:hypothetical protein